ncbi:T9SS type A sorting domain-containing protein [Flavicella marina]|uniref:T9SS type A sorting domain-containing protein n=1 Tax=Flavicella marina TaxID=1475951 RepID=UPI0012654783|nr:T9SS type A sorting domain-containing protein [Flavicella marina]
MLKFSFTMANKSAYIILTLFISNCFNVLGQTTIATENWSSNNYTSGTGWSDNWTENDDDTNSASGKISIVGSELLMTGATSGTDAASIIRNVDLSGYETAEFSFDYRGAGLMENTDFVYIEYSENNGATWLLLDTFQGNTASSGNIVMSPGQEENTGSYTKALPVAGGSETRIRFRSNISYNDEYFYIDNISIDGEVIANDDNDGDGIPDSIDVDDDNDGILDTVEQNYTNEAILSCEGIEELSFSGAIQESGSVDGNFDLGDVFRFSNVLSGVDALVTISAIENLTLTKLDNDNQYNSSIVANTQFNITGIGTQAYVEYTFDFVVSGTNNSYQLNDFNASFNDIDGNNNYNEQSWSLNPSIYLYNGDTQLSFEREGDWFIGTAGGTEFGGVSPDNPEVNYTTVHSKNTQYKVRFGFISNIAGTASSNFRETMLDFSCNSTYTDAYIGHIDTDGDGIPNYQDLDSDNDGIPDNIEAQTTVGYIAPNGAYDATGLDTAYSGGLTPVNTDNSSDAVDYLDLDSDNDGFTDTEEAGITLSNLFGMNGLDSNYQNNDNYSDPNGNFDNTQTDNFPDSDEDVLAGGDVDYRDNIINNDNDDDNVNDTTDLDDDNDGITDITEFGTCSGSNSNFIWTTEYTNGSTSVDSGDDPIETDNVKSIDNIGITLSKYSNISTDGDFKINDFLNTISTYSLSQAAVQNGSSTHTFSFDTPVYNLSFILYDIDQNTNSKDNIEITIIDYKGDLYTMASGDYTLGSTNAKSVAPGNVFEGTSAAASNSNTGNITFNNLPVWTTKLILKFSNTDTTDPSGTQDIAIGDLSFCIPANTDGDTVFDFRDLDSDNDGILDNIEAQNTSTYIAPSGDYSATGIDLVYGSGLTPLNSDEDTLPNYLDLDADNDGIPDNIEAQNTQNYIVPSGNYSIFGIDLAYNDGLVPENTDGTDEADYIDLDSDNDTLFDIVESGVGLTDDGNDGDYDGVVGTNGLADSLDSVESGDTYTDVNGIYDASFINVFNDEDSDVNTASGDLDYRDVSNGVDTDSDGVVDSIDIDDDNDGILDVDELECFGSNPTIVVDNFNGTSNNTQSLDGTIANDNGTILNGVDEYIVYDLGNNFPINSSIRIHLWATGLASYKEISISQSTSATANTDINNTQLANTNTIKNSEVVILDYIIKEVDARYIEIRMTERVDYGRIEIVEISSCSDSADSDNDGIINSLDIDSDNDGIPDNVEAQTTLGYITPSGVGSSITDDNNNGLDDNYETPQGGTYLTLINTDSTNDSIYDFLDTDSDNDGTLDIEENGDSDNTVSGIDTDGDGLDDNFEGSNSNDGFVVNNEITNPSTDLPDLDSDVDTQDVDYRDDVIDNVDPAVVGNTLWLRADIGVNGGNDVTLWEDQSDSEADFTGAGTPDNTITANNLNFNPVVTFIPSDNDYLTYSGNLNPATVYYVYNDTSTEASTSAFNSEYGSMGHGHSDDTKFYSDQWANQVVYNGAGYVNGASVTILEHDRPDTYELISNIFTAENTFNNNDNYTVGKDKAGQASTRVIDGNIAEIMVFSERHDGTKRQEIESYLAIKYGFTLSSSNSSSGIIDGDYTLAGNTKTWNYSNNSAFHNDVAGIGRDDSKNLKQRQSKSINSDAIITIGLEAIATTNLNNPNNFDNNKDFLVWGNDNGSLATTTTEVLVCAPEKHLDRTWKIVESGSVVNVEIAVDKSTIDNLLNTGYTQKVLKIADDKDFLINVHYAPLTEKTINGSQQYSTNYDFNGTKYFTYAEVNGIFWNGDSESWSGGSAADGSASTNVADKDKVMVIDSETSYNHALLEQNAIVECVWVKEGSELTIDTDKYLEFDEDFILQGNIRMIGDAQLVQTHPLETNVEGNGKVYRDQKATVSNVYRYHYWSSPVVETQKSTFRVGAVMKDGTSPTTATSTPKDINFVEYTESYDGAITDPITIANYWIWSYVNGSSSADWQHKKDSGILNRGEGFTMKSTGRSPQNFTFVGKPNDGTIEIDVDQDTNSLIGNPYPSALDSYEFLSDNADIINGGTLYFWEHTGEVKKGEGTTEGHNIKGYKGGYSTRNMNMGVAPQTPTSGVDGLGDIEDYNEPGRYIAVGQAFYIGAKEAGTIKFENSQRKYQSINGGDSKFLKSGKKGSKTETPGYSKTEIPTYLKIGFEYDNESNINIHRQIGISFDKRHSFELDYGYDSYAFDVQPTDAYWQFANSNNKYSIAGIEEIHDALTFPITLTLDETKKVKILLDEHRNLEREVYLTDEITHLCYKLSETPVSIELPAGTYTDRFTIGFKDTNTDDTAGVVDLENFDFSFYYENKSRKIIFLNPEEVSISEIQLISTTGTIIKNDRFNTTPSEIEVQNISQGIYILQIKTSKGIVKRKIALY